MHSCIYTHALTCSNIHTLHTCYSCKWYFLSSLMCAFSAAVFCWPWRRPIAAEGFPPLWDRELWGKLLLGKDKSGSGGVEGLLALVKKNIVQASHIYAEAIYASTKNFLMVVHCVQSTPLKWGLGVSISLGEHICWLSISQSSCLFSGE